MQLKDYYYYKEITLAFKPEKILFSIKCMSPRSCMFWLVLKVLKVKRDVTKNLQKMLRMI